MVREFDWISSTYIVGLVGLRTTVKDRLRAINETLLRREAVDCVWPEMGDQFDDSSRASDNTAMRAVVHREFKDAQLRL
jgi:hypothetical protein